MVTPELSFYQICREFRLLFCKDGQRKGPRLRKTRKFTQLSYLVEFFYTNSQNKVVENIHMPKIILPQLGCFSIKISSQTVTFVHQSHWKYSYAFVVKIFNDFNLQISEFVSKSHGFSQARTLPVSIFSMSQFISSLRHGPYLYLYLACLLGFQVQPSNFHLKINICQIQKC